MRKIISFFILFFVLTIPSTEIKAENIRLPECRKIAPYMTIGLSSEKGFRISCSISNESCLELIRLSKNSIKLVKEGIELIKQGEFCRGENEKWIEWLEGEVKKCENLIKKYEK